MQSGISVFPESFDPKPRRSIDPSAFSESFPTSSKPSNLMTNPAEPVGFNIGKTYSKTPVSNAIRVRSHSNVDPSQLPNYRAENNNATNTKRMNLEFNLEGHIKKTRQAGRYLKQIIHSKDCTEPHCAHPTCPRTKQILLHVEACVLHNCQIPGCQTTKRLVEHAKTCHNSWYKIHATTTAQQDFCLLCTIAHCEENNRALHRQPSYSYEDTDAYQMNEKDARLLPMISDEIIEFSRVPFQSFPTAAPAHLSPTWTKSADEAFSPRAKTYSDSNFALSSNESNKKQRSKSWAVPSSPSYDPKTSVLARVNGTSPFPANNGLSSSPMNLLFPRVSLPSEEGMVQYMDQQVERMNSLISGSSCVNTAVPVTTGPVREDEKMEF